MPVYKFPETPSKSVRTLLGSFFTEKFRLYAPNTAIQSQNESALTYKDLLNLVNSVAVTVLNLILTSNPNTPSLPRASVDLSHVVVICVPSWSNALYILILSLIKLGVCYVCLDPAQPKYHKKRVIELVNPRMVPNFFYYFVYVW